MRFTEPASFEDRQNHWEQALEAAEQHIKMGMTLQGQGVEILKLKQNGTPDAAVRLVQQATATIGKGVKLEREARDKVIELYLSKSKEQ